MTLQGSDLRLRLRGKDPVALAVLTRALEAEGIAGACRKLSLSRTTLYRLGDEWPAIGKALTKHAMDPVTRGVVAGLASAASGRGGRRKR